MTSKISMFAAVATLAACAQTGTSARVAYAPRGQAAQPGSWSGPSEQVAEVSGSAQGQAAQPGSWSPTGSEPELPALYMTGLPAGQAAQPGAWNKSAL